jgi:glutamate synthase (NADPH) large chain
VVVLGRTGRNFAAGMSGGIAYVLDETGNFDYFCNKGLVDLVPVEDKADITELQTLINNHLLYTHSTLASGILTNWEGYLPKFVKVMPFEYRKFLEEQKLRNLQKKLQMTEDDPSLHE